MLLRLQRETHIHEGAADEDRLQLLAAVSPERYAAFLCRIWGFEAPLEAAFARTSGLAELIDLRGRTQNKLLRADLAALGVTSPSTLPCCRTIPSFDITNALGWMYAIEHNALLHGQLRRHLEKRLPTQYASAGSYLAGGERTVSSRRVELGLALDKTATTSEIAKQLVEAARIAFQHQRQWFRAVAAPVERHPHPAA